MPWEISIATDLDCEVGENTNRGIKYFQTITTELCQTIALPLILCVNTNFMHL